MQISFCIYKPCYLISHGTSLWCNLVIVAQISLEMVVTKKKMMHLYIGSKEMKYEKRKKNGTRYSLNTSICFNCSFLYCFHIITGIKHKSYSFITTGMLSISNLDYLAMSKLPLLCTNLMSPFSKYSFITCLILQVKIYIYFFKEHFKDP